MILSALVVLVLVVLVLVAGPRLRAREARLFPHGRTRPGKYCPGPRVTTLAVGDPLPADAQSVLVELPVRVGGRFGEVRIGDGDASARHPLPAHTTGFAAFAANPATPPRLSLDGVRTPGAARVLVSRERPGADESLLVLAPHPDDAELAAHALYRSQRGSIWVVTATAGEYGMDHCPTEAGEATQARALRRARESLTTPVAAGVPAAHCRNLLFPDQGLSYLNATPARESYPRARVAAELGQPAPAPLTFEGFCAALRAVVAEARPAIIVAPDPVLDGHADHVALTQCLLAALADLPAARPRALYLYTIHARLTDAAPFGPEGGPWDPPPLPADCPLDAFYLHPVSAEALLQKRLALSTFSDLRPPPPLPLWRRLLGLPSDPTNLFRRCLRAQEWFRVTYPAEAAPPPLVSILIPAYNAGRWLAPCIESALAQTHRNIEVIVWNDGSTDDSAAVLAGFGDRITVLGGHNVGSNVARNHLLAAARGEWVQFLDADDALLPDKIALQLTEAAPADDVDVIYSPTISEFWTDGICHHTLTSEIDPRLDVFSQWFLYQMSQANGSLWRRAAIQRIGGWKEDQPCCQDNELYARALRAGLRFRVAPSARAIYRTWSTQTISRRNPLLVLQVRLQLLREMVAWIRDERRWRREHALAAGQASVEILRNWYNYDAPAAIALAADCRRGGHWHPRGPAAPFRYRLLCRTLGFAWAERLASRVRTAAP